MSFTRKLLLVAAIAAPFGSLHSADEKKDEKKPEPPRIVTAVPFAIVAGATNKLIVRGLSLTNASEVRFPSTPSLAAEIKSRGKANLPDKADPKKLGDTQLEILLNLPPDFATGDLPFTVSTPDGETNTNLLHIVARELLIDEKEPNGSFRKPNDASMPQTIRGVIQEANDVDVFRFSSRAGQRIVIETKSARYGSSLDALLTLYDSQGHVLATSDDADNSDARITHVPPRGENYFIALNDAHDRGGPTYTYIIEIREEPAPGTATSGAQPR